MATGKMHFQSVRMINLSSNASRAGVDIYFERAEIPAPTNKNVEALRKDYEETMFVLQSMEMPDEKFYDLFNALLEGAKVGLEGESFSVEAGRTQLEKVRRNMISLARSGRDAYLKKLGMTGALVAVISFVLAALVYSGSFMSPGSAVSKQYSAKVANWLLPACLLHPGVALGVVFMGFLINRSYTFDKIMSFDPYYFSPGMRMFFVSVVSYVLFAALWFKLIMLGVGGFLLNSVTDTPAAALLIGLVCGVSEPVVVDLLLAKLKPVEKKAKS